MKNKNEIHLNIDTDKSISLPDLCKAVRKGQLIAASIDKKNSYNINELLKKSNDYILNTSLTINKTSFLTPHLDIGGSGETIIYKISKNELTIIDLNIDKEIDDSRVDMYEMDAGDLAFPDGKFLTITSFYTLMYVCYGDLLSIFNESFRVLKNGGVVKIWDVHTTQMPSGFTNVSIDLLCGKKTYHANYSSNAIQEIRDREFYRALLLASGFKNININIQNNYAEIEAYKLL
ncbi:MAG: class I SAM-dependent methyltransferase [Clostridiales bacterium]|nr:class I SAM-dependent methyltransferase [Clostridiales bacterium]